MVIIKMLLQKIILFVSILPVKQIRSCPVATEECPFVREFRAWPVVPGSRKSGPYGRRDVYLQHRARHGQCALRSHRQICAGCLGPDTGR